MLLTNHLILGSASSRQAGQSWFKFLCPQFCLSRLRVHHKVITINMRNSVCYILRVIMLSYILKSNREDLILTCRCLKQ